MLEVIILTDMNAFFLLRSFRIVSVDIQIEEHVKSLGPILL